MRVKTISNIALSLFMMLLYMVPTKCIGRELVYLKHITQRGETIKSMAEMYDVKADMLKMINGIDTFYTGIEVLIPIDKKYLWLRTEEDSEDILKDLAGYFSGFYEATRIFDTGDYKKACKMYASTIHSYGKYFPCEEAYFAIAMCNYNLKKWSSAIDGFVRVMGIDECSDELRNYSRRLMEDAEKHRKIRQERTANIFGGILQAAVEVGTAYMATSQQNVMDNGIQTMPQGKSLGSMSDAEFATYINSSLAQIANISVMQVQQQWAMEEMLFKNNFIASYRRMHGCDPSAQEIQAVYNEHMQSKANAYSTVQRVSSGLYDKQLGIDGSSRTSNSASSGRSCRVCYGSGKCRTCNGNGTYWDSLNGNRKKCPNCSNGLCTSCGGSGKR